MYVENQHTLFDISVIAKYVLALVCIWFGLYWALSSFFDHYVINWRSYIQSSVQSVARVYWFVLYWVFSSFFDHYIIVWRSYRLQAVPGNVACYIQSSVQFSVFVFRLFLHPS